MRDLNIFFQNAIEDLVFLLDRQYPKKSAIELVGNRYRLGSDERMVLYRGVFDTESTRERMKKLIDTVVRGRLLIDGYNVLITIESYLKGMFVFRSLDSYVRDVSGLYGNHAFSDFTKQSIELIIRFLKKQVRGHGMDNLPANIRSDVGPPDICPPDVGPPDAVYLDYPVSKSGELAAYMRETFEKEGLNVEVAVVKSPDALIIEESRAGDSVVVASSDTVILDRIEKGVDIPAYIIERVFQKKLVDLNDIRIG